jgi:hypothetical protein
MEHSRAFSRIGETMNIDQLTDIAFEVASELEPERNYDVFDVSESEIIFQSEHGLKRVCLSCLDSNRSVKEQIKKGLSE